MSKHKLIPPALLLLVCLWGTAALAQTPATVTVISGNGQMICQTCARNAVTSFQQLTVQVTDASGNPVTFTTVNWAVSSGNLFGQLVYTSTFTDASGITSNSFWPSFGPVGFGALFPYVQGTITATPATGSGSATFTLTQVLAGDTGNSFVLPMSNPNGLPQCTSSVTTNCAQSTAAGTVSGQAGTTAGPFIIGVYAGGIPVPNVAVNLFDVQCGSAASCPSGATVGATIQCATGAGAGTNTVLTSATGIATCNPILGGTPGSGQYWVMVGTSVNNDPTTSPFLLGAYWGWGPLNLQVTPATPGLLKVISGNSQSAQAGQALAAPLVVEVDTTSGSPLQGQAVTWSVSPSSAATMGSTSTTTGASGQASNTVQFASTANGTVTVTANVTGVSPVSFTLRAVPNVTVTGLSIVSGNNQAAIQSTAFGAPLVVQLTASGGGVSGIPVQFSITGSATLSATSATTNSSGQASVTVTAGATPGAVTVTATAGSFSQTFNLTVSPPGPQLTVANFLNGADFQRGALSPCSIATIIADSGLAPGLQGMISGNNIVGPLPFNLAGDSLTVSGSSAPIFNVGLNAAGKQQLTFQVPCDVTPGSSVPVVVNVGAGNGSVNIPILAASPGVFLTTMSDNVARAVIVRVADGSFVSLTNPARKGEPVVAFVTGMGPSNPPVSTDGLPVPGVIATPQSKVVVGMAGQGVPAGTVQLSPDLVGVWEVPFTIPASITSTNYPACGSGNCVTFSVSVIPTGSSTPIPSATTTIPVQ